MTNTPTFSTLRFLGPRRRFNHGSPRNRDSVVQISPVWRADQDLHPPALLDGAPVLNFIRFGATGGAGYRRHLRRRSHSTLSEARVPWLRARPQYFVRRNSVWRNSAQNDVRHMPARDSVPRVSLNVRRTQYCVSGDTLRSARFEPNARWQNQILRAWDSTPPMSPGASAPRHASRSRRQSRPAAKARSRSCCRR
jgi:hypothetical protein